MEGTVLPDVNHPKSLATFALASARIRPRAVVRDGKHVSNRMPPCEHSTSLHGLFVHFLLSFYIQKSSFFTIWNHIIRVNEIHSFPVPKYCYQYKLCVWLSILYIHTTVEHKYDECPKYSELGSFRIIAYLYVSDGSRRWQRLQKKVQRFYIAKQNHTLCTLYINRRELCVLQYKSCH